MRRWRVGTCSMGVSLVLVGVTLLISAWKGLSAFDTLLGWWPVVFIMLGLEILLFIALSKKEQSDLHYDIFSILFVGVLICCCMAFALATSTGLMRELRFALGSVQHTVDLPDITEAVPQGVERIVVQFSGPSPKIDKTTARELHLFGNYRTRSSEEQQAVSISKQDFATIHTIGNTMYVAVKEPARRSGINDFYPVGTMTVTLPQDIPFELRGPNNQAVKVE